MNKALTSLICMGLLLAVLIGSRAGAQAVARQRWEYGVLDKPTARFRIAEKVFEGKDGFKGLFGALGGAKMPSGDSDRAEDAVLQLLGQGGWELTAVAGERIYFKRPIS